MVGQNNEHQCFSSSINDRGGFGADRAARRQGLGEAPHSDGYQRRRRIVGSGGVTAGKLLQHVNESFFRYAT
jgi:hypothetical protein